LFLHFLEQILGPLCCLELSGTDTNRISSFKANTFFCAFCDNGAGYDYWEQNFLEKNISVPIGVIIEKPEGVAVPTCGKVGIIFS
jgi:hypothetical protein